MPEKEITFEGILPDSEAHIKRLETKLKKLKKNDPNKVTGKDLLSSMSQFKEVYMQDYFRHSNTNFEDNPIESVDKSYLERKLLPVQPISIEETLALVQNDWNELKESDDKKDNNESALSSQ